jgi:hypothetical protein
MARRCCAPLHYVCIELTTGKPRRCRGVRPLPGGADRRGA